MRLAKEFRVFVPILLVALAFVFFQVGVNADEKKQNNEPSKQQTGSTDLAAMKAGKNNDGTLRATTKEEEKALADQIKNTLSKYPKHTIKTNPDGSKSIVMVPHSLNFSVATIDSNGKINYSCSNASGLEKKGENKQTQKAEEQ